MEKLNVCLMNDSFPPVIDGVANAVVNYAHVIQERFGTAVVATPQYPGALDRYPFPVVRYHSLDTTRVVGYRTGLPFSGELLRTLERSNPQLIHCHCPLISMLLARTLREGTGVPIVFTYHTKFDIVLKNAVSSGILREAVRRCIINNISASDEVWTVSRGAGENLRQLGYTGDYIVMENGVDFRRGRVPDSECEELSLLHALPEGVPVFLYVGRMMWYKGLDLTLEALAALKKDGLDFRMLFVGGGGDLDEVTAAAQKMGLQDRCIFVGPVYDREKLRAYFCRADLFIFPSTFDTNGIVVREAAACSLPSLLIRGSCAAEGVVDGRNGLLAEENADSIAAAVAAACREPGKLRSIGRAAMDELYLSWEDAVYRAVQRYGLVLERCLSEGHVRSEAPGDEFISTLAESLELLNKVKSAPQELFSMGAVLWNKLNPPRKRKERRLLYYKVKRQIKQITRPPRS